VKTRPFSFLDFPLFSSSSVSIPAQEVTLEDTMTAQAVSPSPIFSSSLLEVSWTQRLRRSFTTLSSFGLQVVILCGLLLIPLLKTIVMPEVRMVSAPISLGRRDVPRMGDTTRTGSSPRTTSAPIIPFVQPGHIPHDIPVGDEQSSLPPATTTACPGCTGLGARDGLPNIFVSGSDNVLPPPPPKPAARPSRPFRTSHMLEGNLIHQVQPIYPPLARTARIQGSVVLSAVIAKDGTIKNLRVLSGHPMLVAAAIDAVRRWRYRPYILNDEPIEVETQITVNFSLTGN
jgi:periplasmic protein TonB